MRAVNDTEWLETRGIILVVSTILRLMRSMAVDEIVSVTGIKREVVKAVIEEFDSHLKDINTVVINCA
jgi:choline kinase